MPSTTTPRRVAVLTGGGDCPGLNAVIRAVAKDLLYAGVEVLGVLDGYLGLIEDRLRPLADPDVSNILSAGGTILGTSNKANPFQFALGTRPDGSPDFSDVSDRCTRTLERSRVDALVVIGGDGSMTIAHQIASRIGVGVVGVPKTIDNDLFGTELTFGFLSAVSTATDALDRLQTTAASHHRVMVLEVMGRNAGWIALSAGVAGGADVILLPEIPFSLDAVAESILERRGRGKRSSIVCVAEGARPVGGGQIVRRVDPTSPDPIRLGGVGKFVADEIERRTGVESRYTVLGHVQRGGSPVAADRILATRFGHYASVLLREGVRDRMVALAGVAEATAGRLTHVALDVPAGKQRRIPTAADGAEREHPLVEAGRALRTCFG
jgi:ATP-dependent phosphofructokinase / diphosphate-dependent phosphofructokinase